MLLLSSLVALLFVYVRHFIAVVVVVVNNPHKGPQQTVF